MKFISTHLREVQSKSKSMLPVNSYNYWQGLTYLLNKPIEENNTNSRKSATQAIIITFIIIIFSTIRIKFELDKKFEKEK